MTAEPAFDTPDRAAADAAIARGRDLMAEAGPVDELGDGLFFVFAHLPNQTYDPYRLPFESLDAAISTAAAIARDPHYAWTEVIDVTHCQRAKFYLFGTRPGDPR